MCSSDLDTLSLDDVASALEPAMKYDPVEHLAYLTMALKNSTITAQFERLGRIYVNNPDSRVDDATLGMYQTFANTVNDAETHHQLGDQYRLRERYQEAVSEYRQALQLDPEHRDTLFNIAACQEYLGMLDEALLTYQQAGKQNPEDSDVTYRLARVHQKMGNQSRALAYIDQNLNRLPSVNAYWLKAKILQATGRQDEAKAVYLEILKLNPDDAEAQYELNQTMAKW